MHRASFVSYQQLLIFYSEHHSKNQTEALICSLNQKFNNKFYLVSNNQIFSCQKPTVNIKKNLKNIFKKHTVFTTKHINDWIVSPPHKSNQNTYILFANNFSGVHAQWTWQSIIIRMLSASAMASIALLIVYIYISRPTKKLKTAMRFFKKGAFKKRARLNKTFALFELFELKENYNDMTNSIESVFNIKTRVLQHIAHELKAPLTRQLVAIDILEQTNSLKKSENIQKILAENERMNSLIKEILDIAKVNSQLNNMTLKPVFITKKIKDIIKQFPQSNHTFDVKIAIDEQTKILVDDSLLSKALNNVISNAIKYADKNTAVTINVFKKQNLLYIVIENIGSGVEEELLPFIFEPFVRGKHNNYEGHGLGLAIAKACMQVHKGAIKAENISPQGFRVIITLNMEYYG